MPLPQNFIFGLFCFWFLMTPLHALTLEQLKNDADLTPEKFAAQFSRFKYQFRAEVQEPEQFLARRSGDCDDYAVLAAEVLSGRGYTPRLIAVRLKREVHVVCYIEETGSYLDYNLRSARAKTVRTDGSYRDIANRVAAGFRCSWRSVSEFTYEQGRKRLVQTKLQDERGRFEILLTESGAMRISR
jgi:hypothetical protein